MKDEIRQKLKIKRRYFQGVRREAADNIIADVFSVAYLKYDSFLVYNSFSTEADTKRIIDVLLREGKKVYLPRVEGEEMTAVPFTGAFGVLKKGAFGIEEAQGQAFEGDIDVTVIPLLAVNENGYRIGYGKGYYDKYLRDRHTKKVGLGYYFQIENFKEDAWDIPLDAFICEKGIYLYATDK